MSISPLLLFSIPAAALAAGLLERNLLSRQASSFEYRINVNGTRGKSTLTRLLVNALVEAGIPTVGKTTGTKSAILFFKDETRGFAAAEKELARRPEGANIREVKYVMREAARRKARAVVAECMALDPHYQKIFSLGFLKSNINIITNVLEDHMEVMGPTLKDVAESFIDCVPPHSTLIVAPGKFLDFFMEKASGKGIRIHVADPAGVPGDYCETFSFPVFPENIALALKTAEVLGIQEEVAMAGMLKTAPDPGALSFQRFAGRRGEGTLINAFSANDPSSTLYIWNYLKEKCQVNQGTTILMNCRNDRVERARLFAGHVLTTIATRSLILMGEGTRHIAKQGLPYREVVDLGGLPAGKVARYLQNRCRDKDVFLGIGNYSGVEDLCSELKGGGEYV